MLILPIITCNKLFVTIGSHNNLVVIIHCSTVYDSYSSAHQVQGLKNVISYFAYILKYHNNEKINNFSSFCLDFKATCSVNSTLNQALSLDFKKTAVYFYWNFPM